MFTPFRNSHLTMVEGFGYPNDPSSYVVGDCWALVGSPRANWYKVRCKKKCSSKDFYDGDKQGLVCLFPEGHQGPDLEPGLGKGSERPVARSLSIGSGQAQPEKDVWICPHAGPPPTGGAIEVW